MFARSVNLALLSAAAFTAVQAQYAGDLAAVAACKGFPSGAFKCVSFLCLVVVVPPRTKLITKTTNLALAD